MKPILLLAAVAALALASSPVSAEEGGCLKYGAGGAVAGHFVGKGHAGSGAAVGCGVGAYKRHEARKEEARARNEETHEDQR
jgi:hypothetical protein